MTELVKSAIDQIETVIKGKREVIELVFTSLVAGGHCLIEDLPGSGKTLLAKCVAKTFYESLDDLPTFKRIQFTPDLLPSDILGVNVFNPANGEFRFVRGPIFTRILLADEINRAGPKVQSALLEAMAEFQVTVDNETRFLPKLFFVIATQNPLEVAGTHPLPIAQLDRFLMRIPMNYPDPETEENIVTDDSRIQENFNNLKPLLKESDILQLRQKANDVYVCPAIIKAICELGIRSRLENKTFGLSTRALILLKRCIQAKALLHGRDFATDKDFFDLAVPVCNHRLGVRNLKEANEVVSALIKPLFKTLPMLVVEELERFRLS
ncbi:MAG: AAA family ATPase [Deltaproteobacteria bacterium]|nr:AAA family ATPase [Deltaproteobacteria bacterium]